MQFFFLLHNLSLLTDTQKLKITGNSIQWHNVSLFVSLPIFFLCKYWGNNRRKSINTGPLIPAAAVSVLSFLPPSLRLYLRSHPFGCDGDHLGGKGGQGEGADEKLEVISSSLKSFRPDVLTACSSDSGMGEPVNRFNKFMWHLCPLQLIYIHISVKAIYLSVSTYFFPSETKQEADYLYAKNKTLGLIRRCNLYNPGVMHSRVCTTLATEKSSCCRRIKWLRSIRGKRRKQKGGLEWGKSI